ncbi:MAG: tRNA (adenosine(37)-N6)-dimethylallyltransferase MiaA [Alphaproteobacteria bacterium GM7ARS4]|nr:tRNA (adenosine(37)-N6)-dimethylallyltransferase MiaA [Alphaproteobacteria bacterium GM7ARS4]
MRHHPSHPLSDHHKKHILSHRLHGLVITGPTASGKSHVAFALAQHVNGMVINADAMQVYRDIPIISDAPTRVMGLKVPHRLYGFVEARQTFSAQAWRLCAIQTIKHAHQCGYMPILVGGSGLYLKALFQGLDRIPPIPNAIRCAVRLMAQTTHKDRKEDRQAWHSALARIDPLSAARIHPHDRQRLARAWEVFLATHTPLSTWQKKHDGTEKPYGRHRHNWHVVQLHPPRSVLYARCDRRVRHMLSRGALNDVRRLQAQHLDPQCPAMKALGVRPLMDVLNKRLSIDQARAIIQRDTRQYAKRQYTWQKTQGLRPSIIIRHIPLRILTIHSATWCRAILHRRLSPQHPIQL